MIKTITKHYIDAETVREITKGFAEKEYVVTDFTVDHAPEVVQLSNGCGWREYRASNYKTETATLIMGDYEITIKKSR